ncbi:hypothetical protein SKA53_10874 [Yoonia vestfoldensis SKA53]|uniref:Uncharacterized protein n=1 Tax=Yoonia vestfoldensis SKA53 TaxID=314232 RepID=A3V1M7_9RHOB|nr:hypothetical protein SKA53_10874 [Yoonia vestfoldensis SKA53]
MQLWSMSTMLFATNATIEHVYDQIIYSWAHRRRMFWTKIGVNMLGIHLRDAAKP